MTTQKFASSWQPFAAKDMKKWYVMSQHDNYSKLFWDQLKKYSCSSATISRNWRHFESHDQVYRSALILRFRLSENVHFIIFLVLRAGSKKLWKRRRWHFHFKRRSCLIGTIEDWIIFTEREGVIPPYTISENSFAAVRHSSVQLSASAAPIQVLQHVLARSAYTALICKPSISSPAGFPFAWAGTGTVCC